MSKMFEYVLYKNNRVSKRGFKTRDEAVQYARRLVRQTKQWMSNRYSSNPTISEWGYSVRRKERKEVVSKMSGSTTRKSRTSR